ncbi:E3 ubiquitin-protein ligase ubr3 [Cichlidogyrus casuarinus]|uniref:E3 ubiquitin-protein ligase n=1 Tax=Cichlidogyrus casuarinus TaxID=1844966 RepID=A0ABD2QH68_9PLAT
MDFFEEEEAATEDFDAFIQFICTRNALSKHDLLFKFREACINSDVHSPIFVSMIALFPFDAFMPSTFVKWETKMDLLCRLFEFLISKGAGFDVYGKQLKEYDYSAACGLVWTNNYFAYRCRTCGLSPTMSLCTDCFNAGNHEGHDFNKFKSHAGGVCDCGDASVIKPSGNCHYHGPDKVSHRPTPPDDLVAVLKTLLPHFCKALLFFCIHIAEFMNKQDTIFESNGENLQALHLLQRLQSYGWVPQKFLADILLDQHLLSSLLTEAANTDQIMAYRSSLVSKPIIRFPECVKESDPFHKTMMEVFLFLLVKLRFPEPLVTFLIGLFSDSHFKEIFAGAYLDHYSRIASSIMLAACTRQNRADECLQISNRIIHASVQLFSGEFYAIKMVKERQLHHCVVSCLLKVFNVSLTTLDDRGHRVVNPDSVLIRNNVFWPMMSDLINLLAHKTIVDLLMEDQLFLTRWTKILRYMQFANCFFLKEGNHIEYETMGFYHTYTMDLEMSVNTMWNIWCHYSKEVNQYDKDRSYFHLQADLEHCLSYTKACLQSLAVFLAHLGNIVPHSNSATSIPKMNPRVPLSFHIPLMRHVACFLSLVTVKYKVSLLDLLKDFMEPSASILLRWMQEITNILLGSHEVVIGYWIRNGHPIRQSVSHYLQTQFCYSYIDLDIFAMQVCSTLLPPAYILNALIDETKLLRNINLHQELLNLVTGTSSETTEERVRGNSLDSSVDRKPMALESWLVTLTWILDLRNNLELDETILMRKELIYCLASGSRKRSDLTSLIPERYSLTSQLDMDPLLEQVAHFSAPTIDETVGSARPGEYALKSHLWHEEFDPVFHSLRCSSRPDSSHTLERYRDHIRQAHGVKNPTNLWPPFKIPERPNEEFKHLENLLQSRHLHYLLFSQLAMYVYDSKVVSEESLALIVHLLNRAVQAALSNDVTSLLVEPRDMNEQIHMTEEEEEELLDSPQSEQASISVSMLEERVMEEDLGDQTTLMGPRFLIYRNMPGFQDRATNSQSEEEVLFNRLTNTNQDATESDLDDYEDPVPFVDESPLPPRRYKVQPKKGKPLQWHISLRACPYRTQAKAHISHPVKSDLTSTGNILDNVTTRLCSVASPQPQVFQLEKEDPTSLLERPRLIDSIISLLIKVHAKLRYSYEEDGTNTAVVKAPLQFLSHFSSRPELNNKASSQEPASLHMLFNSTSQWQNFAHDQLEHVQADVLFFAANAPAYMTPKERKTSSKSCTDSSSRCAYTGEKDWGDGVFYVEKLLDRIFEAREDLQHAMAEYLARARNPFHSQQACEPSKKTVDVMQPEQPQMEKMEMEHDLKKLAEAKRQKIMSAMQRKQKAFTERYSDVIAAMSMPSDVTGEASEDLGQSGVRHQYECAICQSETPPNGDKLEQGKLKYDLVLLSMLCESGLMQQMREIGRPLEMWGSRIRELKTNLACRPVDPDGPLVVAAHTPRPTLVQEQQKRHITLSGTLGIGLSSPSSPPAREPFDTVDQCIQPAQNREEDLPAKNFTYLDVRQWWRHAFSDQFSHNSTLPSLLDSPSMQSGLIIQTCGHAVHQSCFLAFKSTSSTRAWPGRNKSSLLCPLCRRDIHHTVPIFVDQLHGPLSALSFKNLPRNSTAIEQLSALNKELMSLPAQGLHLWNHLDGQEGLLNVQRKKVIKAAIGHQLNAVCLLRSQLEMELSVLITCPLQYSTVARRCHWTEFLSYLHHMYGEAREFNSIVARLMGWPVMESPKPEESPSTESETLPRPATTPSSASGSENRFPITRRGATRRRPSAGIDFYQPMEVDEDRDDQGTQGRAIIQDLLNVSDMDFESEEDQFVIMHLHSPTSNNMEGLRRITKRQAPPTPLPKLYLTESPLLFQEPTDVFLAALPSIWPREDVFLTWVKAILCLNFTRVLIGLCLNQPETSNAHESLYACARFIKQQKSVDASEDKWWREFVACLDSVMERLGQVYFGADALVPKPESSLIDLPQLGAQLETINLETGLIYNGQMCDKMETGPGNSLHNQVLRFLASRLVPFMRIAALCLGRWHSSSTPNWSDAVLALPFVGSCRFSMGCSAPVPSTSKDQSQITPDLDALSEFYHLAHLLKLSPDDESDLSQVMRDCFAVYSDNGDSLSRKLQPRLNIWFGAILDGARDAVSPWLANLGSVMEIGRQLYTPRLVRPPETFDELFNELHTVPCGSTLHRHQENALCLICGRLICIVCSHNFSFVEHAYICNGFSGIVLEINTSLVHVSLGTYISDWGSIYLDAYGEEDAHLKRGKPLYLNHQRLALLEQQWLTHSFRHVLKNWRSPSSI